MNKHAYKVGDASFEKPNMGERLVVRDEDRTIKQLMERYKAGMSIDDQPGNFFDPEDVDHINRFYQPGSLDLTDLEELKMSNQRMTEAIEKAEKAKAAADAKAKEEADLDRKLEEREAKRKAKQRGDEDVNDKVE